jgi:hypothetical protein
MAVFFPVVQAGTAEVQVNGESVAVPDTLESAWSIMNRLQQSASVTGNAPFTLTFNESSSKMTLASTSGFAITIPSGATYTGFVTTGTLTTTTSSVISGVQICTGLTVDNKPISYEGGMTTADGSGFSLGSFQRGNCSISISDSYSDIYSMATTLRTGIWDVVQHDRWIVRIRVTGCRIVPQGIKQSLVTLELDCQVVA